jgi:hypothetical protein
MQGGGGTAMDNRALMTYVVSRDHCRSLRYSELPVRFN